MYNDKNGQMLNNRLSNPRQAANRDARLNMPVTDGNGGNLNGGSCGCVSCCGSTWGLHEYPLGTVYSPCQEWRNLYSPTKALSRGTLFSELDMPFEGKNCNGGKGCRG